jgi:hypothetical protein
MKFRNFNSKLESINLIASQISRFPHWSTSLVIDIGGYIVSYKLERVFGIIIV